MNGFEGNTSIASGDDVFLLEKMHKTHPDQTCYLKSDEVTVESKSEKNWYLFFNQQLRSFVQRKLYLRNYFSQINNLIPRIYMSGAIKSSAFFNFFLFFSSQIVDIYKYE